MKNNKIIIATITSVLAALLFFFVITPYRNTSWIFWTLPVIVGILLFFALKSERNIQRTKKAISFSYRIFMFAILAILTGYYMLRGSSLFESFNYANQAMSPSSAHCDYTCSLEKVLAVAFGIIAIVIISFYFYFKKKPKVNNPIWGVNIFRLIALFFITLMLGIGLILLWLAPFLGWVFEN